MIVKELAKIYKSITPLPELEVSSFDIIRLNKCSILVPNVNYSNPKCTRLANSKPLVNEIMNDICSVVIPGEVFIISNEYDLTGANEELEKTIKEECSAIANQLYPDFADFIEVAG
jgi:hypothetical protein